MADIAFSFDAKTTRYRPANAYWLGRFAQLAYRDANVIKTAVAGWGFGKFRFFDNDDTQAFVAGSAGSVIVAFRGTEPKELQDWLTDADCRLVSGPFGKVHDGFYGALREVWDDIAATISQFQDKAQSLWFTGHSLGAALAALAVASLRDKPDKPVYGLYTFGQPRTGDRNFERTFDQDFESQCFRFVNNNDLVTRVPMRAMGYSHVGTFLYFDEDGDLKDDPGLWFRFLDSMKGSIEDLGKPGLDGINDHSMDRYLANLKKNLSVNPFER
jgi:triacylglycerol lipase